MNNTESALFPTAEGRVCSKQSVVDTIRKAIDLAGGSSKDAAGSWRVSGHTFRITGARTLCRWGLDPVTVQLIGRWGSAAVLTYISEAPLEGFHERLTAGESWTQVRASLPLVEPELGSDLNPQSGNQSTHQGTQRRGKGNSTAEGPDYKAHSSTGRCRAEIRRHCVCH